MHLSLHIQNISFSHTFIVSEINVRVYKCILIISVIYGLLAMNDTKYYKLTNAPLIFVLAEFRFTEVMNMHNYVHEIQDKLRHKYPYFNTGSTQEVNVSKDGLDIKATNQWAFIDKNRSNAIILDHKRLVFVTSDYQRFEQFKHSCEEALEVLIECVKPALLTRLGLRYADLIIPKDKMNIKDYVYTNFLKNPCLDNIGKFSRQTNESNFDTEEGLMIIRSMHGNNSISTWYDIDTLPVEIKANKDTCERVLLDFDHVWQSETTGNSDQPLDFDLTIVLDKLERMHKLSREAFWDSTTQQAKDIWK